jgi:lipopolysaccharide/colanic/teichoic acid biosynthesis glycosyltransferase
MMNVASASESSAAPGVLPSAASFLPVAEAAVPAPDFAAVFSPGWSRPLPMAVKRLIDIVGSAALLVLLSPLLVFLGALVKLSSRGPVLYRAHVVGEGGRPFTNYKFRSMIPGADRLKTALYAQNEMTWPMFKLTGDPRITPLGAWMRRYSLDELPQLYSVLVGDMSLVGPRPPLASEYQHFTPFQTQKLAVRPGITCLWQVRGRNRISDLDDWVVLDLEYIRDWCFALDFRILMATVREVFRGSGK